MAQMQLFGCGDKAIQIFVGDRFVDEDALQRDADLTVWAKAPCTERLMAISRSASGSMIAAELLPSSRVMRLRPAWARKLVPTATLPVKVIIAMAGVAEHGLREGRAVAGDYVIGTFGRSGASDQLGEA